MVGQFLFWLQECKKQVFVVATANDVSMLPSELLRRGRFDELFFVDLPTAEERQEILSLYMEKYLNLDFMGPLSEKIIALTEGFTGADLESTVRDLAYRVIANDGFVLNPRISRLLSTMSFLCPKPVQKKLKPFETGERNVQFPLPANQSAEKRSFKPIPGPGPELS